MAYGLQIYSDAGVLRLQYTHKITRLIHTRSIPAAQSSSYTLPSGIVAGDIGLVYLSPYQVSAGHIITASGSTVTWTSQGEANPTLLTIYAYK